MAKTMRRIVITCILLILIAMGASALLLSGGCSTTASDPLAKPRADIANTIINTSGVKDHLDKELRSHVGDLAESLGLPASMAEDIVDTLDVKDWKAVPLPEGEVQTAAFNVNVQGTQVALKTYEDPSVVTVGAFGQDITFEVPESAQAYTPYLQYLQYLES